MFPFSNNSSEAEAFVVPQFARPRYCWWADTTTKIVKINFYFVSGGGDATTRRLSQAEMLFSAATTVRVIDVLCFGRLWMVSDGGGWGGLPS